MTAAYASPAQSRSLLASAADLIRRADALVTLWGMRRWQRRTLAAMPPRLLADAGIDPFQAHVEINKPFWRA